MFSHHIWVLRRHTFPTHPKFWKNVKNSRRNHNFKNQLTRNPKFQKSKFLFFEKWQISKISKNQKNRKIEESKNRNFRFLHFRFLKFLKLKFLHEFLTVFQNFGCVGKVWRRRTHNYMMRKHHSLPLGGD